MKTITYLRDCLFEQLEKLKNSDGQEEAETEIKKSECFIRISDAIIRTVEIEVKVIEAVKELNTGFIPSDSSATMKEIEQNQKDRDSLPFKFEKAANF